FVVWALSDYATMHRKRYRRLPGLVDAWRQPKMAAAWIAARYAERPILELHGDWGQRQEGHSTTRRIHVFSNCRAVEIFLGDRSVAKLEGDTHHALDVEAEAGLAIVARGRSGDQDLSAFLPWHGPAAALQIRLAQSELDADRRQTAEFDVCVVDSDGRLVLPWNGEVGVEATGPVRARCYSHDATILISRGTGRGFVTAAGEDGDATVRVSAPGLGGATATLTCRRHRP
ncbi:MAG: hypothetical protein AAFY88_21845, partial [Acidobacteriota bacterium]